MRQPGYLEGFSIPFLYDDNDGSGYRLLVEASVDGFTSIPT